MNRKLLSLICVSFVSLCFACNGASVQAQGYGMSGYGMSGSPCGSNLCAIDDPHCPSACRGGLRNWYHRNFGSDYNFRGWGPCVCGDLSIHGDPNPRSCRATYGSGCPSYSPMRAYSGYSAVMIPQGTVTMPSTATPAPMSNSTLVPTPISTDPTPTDPAPAIPESPAEATKPAN